MQFGSVEEILDFAIEQEQKAHDLYVEVAETVKRPGLKDTLLGMAEMEMGHRQKLEAIKSGRLPGFVQEKVENLRIADALVDVKPVPNMTYQEVLLLAMKAEQRANELYLGLAEATGDPSLRQVFSGLAQEELKHKNFFETEYDSVILEGN